MELCNKCNGELVLVEIEIIDNLILFLHKCSSCDRPKKTRKDLSEYLTITHKNPKSYVCISIVTDEMNHIEKINAYEHTPQNRN